MPNFSLFDFSDRTYYPALGPLGLLSYLEKFDYSGKYRNITFMLVKYLKKNSKAILVKLKKKKILHSWQFRYFEKQFKKNSQEGAWLLYHFLFFNNSVYAYLNRNKGYFQEYFYFYFVASLGANKARKARSIIFQSKNFEKWILQIFNKEKLIAISIHYYHQNEYVLDICKIIKEKCPKIVIILGGKGIFYYKKNLTKKKMKYVDFIVENEGELGIKGLLEYVYGKRRLEDVPNIKYLKNEKIISNKTQTLDDLDTLPLPKYNFDSKESEIPQVLAYENSRGCEWGKCAFCDLPRFKQYRTKSPQKVYDDLQIINKKYGIQSFWFVNEMMDAKWAYDFSKLMENSQIGWYTYMRIGDYDSNYFNVLYAGGCRKIFFGVESLDQETLTRMRKGITVKQIQKTITLCSNSGIKVVANLLNGLPFQKISNTLQVLKFLLKNVYRIESVNLHQLRISPESLMMKEPEKFDVKGIYWNKNQYSVKYSLRQKIEFYISRKTITFLINFRKLLLRKGVYIYLDEQK